MTLLARVQARRIENVVGAPQFFVSDTCFPQTIDVLRGRAEPLGIELIAALIKLFPGQFDTAKTLTMSENYSHIPKNLPAVSAASFRRWCRNAASITSRRRSSA